MAVTQIFGDVFTLNDGSEVFGDVFAVGTPGVTGVGLEYAVNEHRTIDYALSASRRLEFAVGEHRTFDYDVRPRR